MLTALGGPLGAIITTLGLAATAWLVLVIMQRQQREKAINASQRIKTD